jgi:hypothetical protein
MSTSVETKCSAIGSAMIGNSIIALNCELNLGHTKTTSNLTHISSNGYHWLTIDEQIKNQQRRARELLKSEYIIAKFKTLEKIMRRPFTAKEKWLMCLNNGDLTDSLRREYITRYNEYLAKPAKCCVCGKKELLSPARLCSKCGDKAYKRFMRSLR